MNRTKNLERLQSEEFDLCIIGGGASGAGCALDAALRGLKVALIEKTDFAAETSSRSTKLIHGGVRYLEQAFKNLDFGQLRQVRHGLEERHIVLSNAAHLAHPLALITPVFSWWDGLYFTIGLRLYDIFASRKDTLPSSKWLSKAEALKRMPGLSTGIHSAVMYYDGQLNDARYCLALVQSASEAGAVVVNHLEVTSFQKDESGKLTSMVVSDGLDSERPPFIVHSRTFLNCTGPHADHIRHMANGALPDRIRPSKGVHLMLPLEILESTDAMLIPKTRDGRVVFAIPFEGDLLLGTTDEPTGDLDNEPVLDGKEVDFLIETLQRFVSRRINLDQVKAGFGGLRPLIAASSHPISSASKPQTKSLLRDHEVEYDPTSHLFSLLGGKWTTYRLMARDALDVICKYLQVSQPCLTEDHLLYGAMGYESDLWKKIQTHFDFDEDIAQHLARKYGALAHRVGEIVNQHPAWRARLLPDFPFIKAEVVYAAREEMACEIRDFLARRIRLEITDWEAAKRAAPLVSQLMGDELGWSPEWQKANADKYCNLIDSFIDRSKTV